MSTSSAARYLLPLMLGLLLLSGCATPSPAERAHGIVTQGTVSPAQPVTLPPTLPPGAPDNGQEATMQFPVAGEHSGAELTYRIIDAPNGTFGYDILCDGRLFVHQSNLPGMPGNEGCKIKGDAEKLAVFVIEKMKKGEMPPSVNPQELNTLNIR